MLGYLIKIPKIQKIITKSERETERWCTVRLREGKSYFERKRRKEMKS